MGYGSFSSSDYRDYSVSRGKYYDADSGRVSGQHFEARKIDSSLDPKLFKIRECANNEEHPNTIPVILALDVTGSMGSACKETANALGVIVGNLYKKVKDVEFCIMGIGDLAYDQAPIQMSQFESDVRIAESLDKLFMEHGGGGNSYESYTAAWYMGLKRTKLDCYDKQGRKGIIITMGDETLNPYLPVDKLNYHVKASEQGDVETRSLYDMAKEKFDIFHIAIDDTATQYRYYKTGIEQTFGELLGERLKVATLQTLAKTIEDCITASVGGEALSQSESEQNTNNNEISW